VRRVVVATGDHPAIEIRGEREDAQLRFKTLARVSCRSNERLIEIFAADRIDENQWKELCREVNETRNELRGIPCKACGRVKIQRFHAPKASGGGNARP